MLSSRVAAASPFALLVLFCCVNILNYIDRGIVPGAFSSIGEFIREDGGGLGGGATNSTDTQIGLLQSAFVVGYSVSALGLGHAAQRHPPFKLMAGGLAVWAVAAILSGLAPRYWVLLLARCLSGVGEASFQTVVPPFIEDNAPPKSRGLYLSLFYVAIPVGTALGYGLGGVAPWRWAFIGEALPMLLLLPVLWVLPDGRPKGGASSTASGGSRSLLAGQAGYAPMQQEGGGKQEGGGEGGGGESSSSTAGTAADDSGGAEASPSKPQQPQRRHTFWAELGACLTDPVYLAAVLGYAGFTAVIAGERMGEIDGRGGGTMMRMGLGW